MVVDFGGGTLDTCIIETKNGRFDVKNFHGDYFLGGADLDILLMEDLMNSFKIETKKDLSNSNDPKVKKAKAKFR